MLGRQFVQMVYSVWPAKLFQGWELDLRERWLRAGMDRSLLHLVGCLVHYHHRNATLRDYYLCLLGDDSTPSLDEERIAARTQEVWDRVAGSWELAKDLFVCPGVKVSCGCGWTLSTREERPQRVHCCTKRSITALLRCS